MVAGEKQYFFITVKLDYKKLSYNDLPFIKNKKKFWFVQRLFFVVITYRILVITRNNLKSRSKSNENDKKNHKKTISFKNCV